MKKFWIGLALGALAGGVAALLLAPQSGASTRRRLRRSFEDLEDNLSDAADYLKEQAERLAKEAQKLIDNSKGQVSGAFESAQGYAQSAGGRVSDQVSKLM